jgi:putative spermidine/putrescine transport system permease protein
MMSPSRLGLGFWAAIVVGFQLTPLLVVVLVSFSASPIFDLPWEGLSLRWYERLWTARGFWNAMLLSAQVAAAATAASLILGTLAAIAIHQGRFFGREFLAALLLSPLMLPGLVIGIAMLQGLRMYGVGISLLALFLAHVVVTMPFVVRVVTASLDLFDFEMIDAARTLGYNRFAAILKVLFPNLYPAMLTGGIFAFLASFDNYPVSIFIADARTKTLPIQMLEFLEESSTSPVLAAVSTLLLAFTAVALGLVGRLVGFRRLQTF